MSLLIRLSDDCRFFLAFILVVSSSAGIGGLQLSGGRCVSTATAKIIHAAQVFQSLTATDAQPLRPGTRACAGEPAEAQCRRSRRRSLI